MRKLLALFLVVCGAMSVRAGSASKVTQDPNAPGAATSVSRPDQAAADSRLAQKVTYESGYARLHAATDDLTRITGVAIRAGASTKDWQIRDIPLVVCVKDLSLGKLLSAIAESTHTLLSSQTLDSGEKAYRFYRNKRLQDEIDSKLQAAQQRQYEQIDWAWDAMLKLADSPQAQKELLGGDSEYKVVRSNISRIALSKILLSLGPGARDSIMAGDTVKVDLRDPVRAPFAQELATSFSEMMIAAIRGTGKEIEAPKAEDVATTEMTIKLNAAGEGGHTDVKIATSPISLGHFYAAFTYSLAGRSDQLEELPSLHLPPRPKGEEVADEQSDHPADPKLKPLLTVQDLTAPPFDAKFKLEKPEGKNYPAFAGVITSFARASKLNIVSEDFSTHIECWVDWYGEMFGSEILPSALLKKTQGSWFYNAEDRLLVGWTAKQGQWRMAHRHLIPESLLLSLTGKLEAGVELDDATPVLGLTHEQRNDWIYNNRALMWLFMFEPDVALWQFYDSLSADQKARAKTESGFALAELDPARTIAYLQEKTTQARPPALSMPDENYKSTASPLQAKLSPETLRTAIMRLKTVRATLITMGGASDGPSGWDPRLHHSYVMEISYEKDGQKATLGTSDLGISFPVYSPQREKELASKLGTASP